MENKLLIILLSIIISLAYSSSIALAACIGCTADCPCNHVTEQCDCESHTVSIGGGCGLY